MSQYTQSQFWRFRVKGSYTFIFPLFMLVHSQAAFCQPLQSKHTHDAKKIVPAHKSTAQGIIYFVPIPLDTLVPVSPNTIKKDADKVIPLDAEGLAIFYRIISGKKAAAAFDTTHVRLRLDNGNQPPLFIDQQGIVLRKHTVYSLTPLAFVELDHFIAGLSSNK